ncbi:ABC transporter substrate-binding protein [Paenibacillus yanchengensis]|uniref:ABC transporter substrate-binding protein n=1 Tax=Paenibacillus yanchengensis TaxID=2035833 RepID=A0ABW4YQS4_9BACL
MRKSFVVMLFFSLLLLLAACSDSSSDNNNNVSSSNSIQSSNTNQQQEVDQAEEKQQEQVVLPEPEGELTWFGFAGEQHFEDFFAQYLREKFPKLKINYIAQTNEQRIEQVLASGTAVDLYFSSAGELFEDFIPANMAQDLTPYIKQYGINLDTIDDAYLEQVSIDEKLYLLPVSENKFVMYYNKDIFDRFGVDYPRDGMTWGEALELSKKITRNEGGKQYVGLWLSPKHYMRAAQNSATFIDRDTNKATVNNDDWKLIFEKIFSDFTRDPGVQQKARDRWLAHNDFNKDFVVGMYVYTSGWLNTHEESLAMNWDIAAIPQLEEYPGLTAQPNATYVGISANSAKQEIAMQVVSYLLSEEYQIEVSKRGAITPLSTPAVRDAAFADFPFTDKNIPALFYGQLAPGRAITEYDEIVIEEAFAKDIIVEIVRGNMDVNSALRYAEDKANKLIEERLASE